MCSTSSTAFLLAGRPGGAGGAPDAVQSSLAGLWSSLAVWRQRQARRRAALTIDDRTLADIGLIRAQIEHEACKPFWRA